MHGTVSQLLLHRLPILAAGSGRVRVGKDKGEGTDPRSDRLNFI